MIGQDAPNTLWLVIANVALGVVCLSFVALIAVAVIRDIAEQRRRRRLLDRKSSVREGDWVLCADGWVRVEEEAREKAVF